MMITAADLLARAKRPTEEQIRLVHERAHLPLRHVQPDHEGNQPRSEGDGVMTEHPDREGLLPHARS